MAVTKISSVDSGVSNRHRAEPQPSTHFLILNAAAVGLWWNQNFKVYFRNTQENNDARHSKRRPTPCCRVLPPGVINDLTTGRLFSKFHATAATVSWSVATLKTVDRRRYKETNQQSYIATNTRRPKHNLASCGWGEVQISHRGARPLERVAQFP